MSADPENCWRVLRMMRADPPGHATTGSRRRTFGAALDQAEELWQAAGSIGISAKPIVLFYSLTQAARSICAARVAGGEWEGATGHGLTMSPRPGLPEDETPTLADFRVREDGKGFFQQVAGLLRSPTLAAECTLSELVCSLPEEGDFLLDTEDLRPLHVREADRPANGLTLSDVIQLFVGPLPAELVREDAEANGVTMRAPEPSEVGRWLASYPTLAALGEPLDVQYVNPMDFGVEPRFAVNVRWQIGESFDWAGRLRYCATLLDVPHQDGRLTPSSGLALPAVAGNAKPMQPVVTWWAILYTCSMLARYSPRWWVRLLDLNKSKHAVPLNAVLDAGWNELPRLVAIELTEAYA